LTPLKTSSLPKSCLKPKAISFKNQADIAVKEKMICSCRLRVFFFNRKNKMAGFLILFKIRQNTLPGERKACCGGPPGG